MLIELTLTTAILLSVFVVGLMVLTVGTLLEWRNTIGQFDSHAAGLRDQMAEEFARLSATLRPAPDAADTGIVPDLAGLRQDISAIRADLEWLAGERMIEQAIQMCRDDVASDTIRSECGLSAEALRTIRLLRTH
jgi:hypothetical protein